MKLHRVFLVSLAFLSAVPALGREPVDPVLQATSEALPKISPLKVGSTRNTRKPVLATSEIYLCKRTQCQGFVGDSSALI